MAEKRDNTNLPISKNTLEKLVDNQSKELALRSQELTLRKIEIERSQEYSLKALQAQKEDRKEIRITNASIIKLKTVAYFICFAFILVFCGFAIWMGETKIIIQIMQIAIPPLATGIGGYYFGKMKGYNRASDDRNDE